MSNLHQNHMSDSQSLRAHAQEVWGCRSAVTKAAYQIYLYKVNSKTIIIDKLNWYISEHFLKLTYKTQVLQQQLI